MGTNYHWLDPSRRVDLHIGKSSMGWCFSLHVHPDLRIFNLDDWKMKFTRPGSRIQDEYGRVIPTATMIEIIVDRGDKDPPAARVRTLMRHVRGFDYAGNFAIDGPRGLLRHKIDNFCVGHGDGPWDLLTGDFS